LNLSTERVLRKPRHCCQCVAGPDLLTVKVVIGMATKTEPNFCAAAVISAAAGAYTKYTIVTRAGFNQGFALADLDVRGARP